MARSEGTKTEGLEKVPKVEVGKVVQSYVEDGAARVVCAESNEKGTWDITAEFA